MLIFHTGLTKVGLKHIVFFFLKSTSFGLLLLAEYHKGPGTNYFPC
jgi:hypothetical protein